MKKILFLILLCALTSNCRFKKGTDLPDWAFSPYIKNGVAAVGLAYPNKINQPHESQKLIAENDARVEISKVIHAKFSRIESDILRQINFKNSSQVKKIFDQATEEIIKNLPLSKASAVNTYQDSYGVLYVRLFLKNEDYQKSPKAVQETFQKHVDESNLKNGDREKANEAVRALFGYSKNHYWYHRTDF